MWCTHHCKNHAAIDRHDTSIAEAKQMTDDELISAGIIADKKLNHRNHLDNFFSISVPLVGSIAALISLVWIAPSIEVILLLAITFVGTVIGVNLGLHRYFTHHSYKTSLPLHLLLAFFATVAMQGSITRWVADHRRHHRFTDKPGDVHSPYFDSRGGAFTSHWRGMLHAHIGWMFTGFLSDEKRYARDCVTDPVSRWFSQYYWPTNALFMLVCGVACYLLTQSFAQGLLGVLYVGCVRATAIHHFTWAVNSIGHAYGPRVAGAKDMSTNNFLLTVLTFGDGLHSAHHQQPVRGVNPPCYFDTGGMLLVVLEKVGLIWQLRR
jgi:stearoyl-CoA desaturase (Delta-9 desaturase)